LAPGSAATAEARSRGAGTRGPAGRGLLLAGEHFLGLGEGVVGGLGVLGAHDDRQVLVAAFLEFGQQQVRHGEDGLVGLGGHDDGRFGDAGKPGQFAAHAHESDGIEVEALLDATDGIHLCNIS
jgi:hypothetical protein